jgi:hypothetical protein
VILAEDAALLVLVAELGGENPLEAIGELKTNDCSLGRTGRFCRPVLPRPFCNEPIGMKKKILVFEVG